MDLKDKVVIITGGGRGLGRCIALAVAPEEAKVALVARTKAQLDGVRDEVVSLGGEALPVPTDIADPAQIERMAQVVLDHFGTADVIINNAGTGTQLNPVQDTTLAYWDEMMNVNARGTFLVTRAFLPTLLEKRSGHVININTVVAKKGVATVCAYCASKAAQAAFGESLAAEVRSQGIRVTNMFLEPMNTWLRWAATPDFPKDRVMEPEHVAEAVVDILKLDDRVLVDEIPVRVR